MYKHFASLVIILYLLSPAPVAAQGGTTELSLEQSLRMLREANQSIKIAGKEVEWAKSEHQRINASWYPSLNISGAYVYTANKIEVKQPLNQFTGPAKDFVHSIIPDDQLISSILDQIGTYTLRFPLAPQNLTTIDANLTWPVFAGGKRIYAGRISKSMVGIAEENKAQVDAGMQAMLVESYFGVRLGQKVVEVREQTLNSLEKHYRNALSLEANGMIDKAERLFVQVNMDEARRELESARKDLGVAQNALKTLIKLETASDVTPSSPLFINDSLPPAEHFKAMIPENNYIVNQLKIQDEIADNQLRMGHAGYAPTIALMGKQTLYSHGIQKNLIPRSFVGVGLTWNLFDGLDREKKIRQARITKQTVALNSEKAIDDLGVGVDKLYSQLQNALSSVRALNTTIELSRELVRMRQKAFQEGMATSTEVVDAEVMLSKVQIASLLAYYQFDVALANLLATCGIPGEFISYSNRGRNETYIFRP